MRLTYKQCKENNLVFDLPTICFWDRTRSQCCNPKHESNRKEHKTFIGKWLSSLSKSSHHKAEDTEVQCESCQYSDKSTGVFGGNASDRVVPRVLHGTVPVSIKDKKKIWLDNVNQKQINSILKDVRSDLEEIYISGSPSISNFAFLENFRNLKKVTIWWNNKASQLWDLSKTPEITCLALLDCNRLTDISSLRHANNLKYLQFTSENGNVSSVDPIRHLTSLMGLKLCVAVADKEIRPIIQAGNLKYFSCGFDCFDIDSYAMFEAQRPDVFVDFYNGVSDDWNKIANSDAGLILFAGKGQGFANGSNKDKYDKQVKKYLELKEKYTHCDYVPTTSSGRFDLMEKWRGELADNVGIHTSEEIDQIETILKAYSNMMSNSKSKSQAKNILKDTLKKLESFNESTGFIETEERQDLYDYISSLFKDNWYDELEEILSEADF